MMITMIIISIIIRITITIIINRIIRVALNMWVESLHHPGEAVAEHAASRLERQG